MSDLGPLDRQWGEALKHATATECLSAEDLLGLHEKGRKHLEYDRLMDHVVSCKECMAALNSLRAMDDARKATSGGWFARLQTILTPRVTAPILAGAATLVIIGVGIRSMSRQGSVAIHRPGASQPTDLPRDVALALKQVLGSGQIDIPAYIKTFDPNAGAERGAQTGIHLRSPLATCVETKEVVFKWDKLSDARSYKIILLPGKGPSTTLQVETAPEFSYDQLNPGETYQWQVIATLNGKTVSSPPAMFRVLTDSERRQFNTVEESDMKDPLSIGIAYAHLGLLDQAEAELAEAETGPQAGLATRLRKQIETKRILASK